MRDEQGEGDRETGGVEVSGGTEHFGLEEVEAEEPQMYTEIERKRKKYRG